MVLPIYAYGSKVLREKTIEINKNDKQVREIITNLWDTMYNANGIGLAAPQIGLSLRIFVIDSSQYFEKGAKEAKDKFPDFPGEKGVFINPNIIEEMGDDFGFTEGCLSIPNVLSKVNRKTNILIEYYDENFDYHKKEFYGITARVIQHEYDHLEGKLFLDHISSLKKKMLKKKINKVVENTERFSLYQLIKQ